MANHISLEAQAQVIASILHWKRRQFTDLQVETLEAAERTLRGLTDLRDNLVEAKQEFGDENPEPVTDAMTDGLIELLQLERA